MSRLLGEPTIRLLTIVGPAGVGKTRIAQHAVSRYELAHENRPQVAWVSLAAVEPDDVVSAIAAALGVGDSGRSSSLHGVQLALGSQAVLLVLDNVEHLPNLGPLIAELLSSCPELRCVVTSQTPLRLTGEQLIRLQPLGLPQPGSERGHRIGKSDAVRLFVDRASSVDPELSLTLGNEEVIAEICRRLDGLPLAIELAAARIELFPLADLLDRLDRRLPLLIGGASDSLERHRTLRAAIAWSYDLLSPEERRLFRWLSIFADGFTLDAAEQIAGSDRAVQLVSRLVDASLLQPQHADGFNRLGMLETVREFGQEQLVERGDRDEARRTHASSMRSFILEVEPQLYPSDELRYWLQCVENDLENIRIALRWYEQRDIAECARLVNALGQFWHRQSMLREARDWSERLLAREDLPLEQRDRALVDLARTMNYQLDFSRPDLAETALAGARERGDIVTQSDALTVQTMTALLREDYELGLALIETALAVVAGASDAARLPRETTLAVLKTVLRANLLSPDDGLELIDAQLQSTQFAGDSLRSAMLHWTRGLLEQKRGCPDNAVCSLQEAISSYVAVGERWSIGVIISDLANSVVEDDPELAARLLGFSHRVLSLLGLDQVQTLSPELNQRFAAVALALDQESCMAAFYAGERMNFESGVELALRIGRAGAADPTPVRPVPITATPALTRRLTVREQQVLRLIVAGRSDREIAHELGISYRTTTTFVSSILRKLDVSSRAAAAAWAVRHEHDRDERPSVQRK